MPTLEASDAPQAGEHHDAAKKAADSTSNPDETKPTPSETVKVDSDGSDKEATVSKTEPSESNGGPGAHGDEVAVPLTRTEFILVFLGLALGLLLQALDQTIVTTTLPTIVTEFQAGDLIAWVGTGYMLTSASFACVYGKLSDIFGRKWTFLSVILIFEFGSLLCGLANSMEMLIVGRIVQGVGGGGLFALILIIISDIVSLRERGKYQGMLGSVWGVASILGPVAGGGFTDSAATWRWCFYINLPVGAITFLTVLLFLRFPKKEQDTSFWDKVKKLDYLGLVLILGAVSALILPLQLGGTRWAWNSAQTIGCFCASAVLFGALVVVENKIAKDPIIPPAVFMNVTVYAGLIMAFFIGAAFLSVIYYVPLYFQVVKNDNATISGLKTFPMVVGLLVLSISSGIFISRTGRMIVFVFFGGIVITTSIGLLSLISVDIEYWKLALMIFTAGIGVGSVLQTRVLVVQGAVDPPKIAVVTSLSNFMQILGSTIGVAVTGGIFTNKLQDELYERLPAQFATPENVTMLANAPNAIRAIAARLPNGIGEKILPIYLESVTEAMRFVFYGAIPFAAMIFVCGFFLKNYQRHRPEGKRPSTDESADGTVIEIDLDAAPKSITPEVEESPKKEVV
ncbi:major facilitator superfamily domain-containing protein [Cladochytrium replicatum]|nr:major facilitator superfamily domain-containing protein [Cladochytrium replicatum]